MHRLASALTLFAALVLSVSTGNASEPAVPPAPSPTVPEHAASQPASTPEIWKVPVGTSPVRGPKDALVTLVVFSDFECTFCKRLAPTLEELRTRYPKDLRIVFKHRPLPFHPNAASAARLSIEAGKQGKDALFWKLHDALFAAADLDRDALLALAKDAGMNVAKATKALDEEAHGDRIDEDGELADTLGDRGTPTSYINGVRVLGAKPLEAFVTEVEAALARARELTKQGVPRRRIYEQTIAGGREGDDETMAPLERREAPPVTPATPTRGAASAPVTVHLFTDFECGFCNRAKPTLEKLEKRFKGKVRLAYHSLPLPMHANARAAARLALEAFAQRGNEGFWQAHDLLFDHQDALDRDSLLAHAKTLKLDVPKVAQALDDGRHDPAIDADITLANAAGIHGTPTFLVNGLEVRGAQPLAAFERAVKQELTSLKKQR
ncbi:MAG: thioredoxin domain-containing protein [Deltaproteobacteria bacterium]|nr:thioredoxin domain-containing protein [Deltaproteobacteria bacterium]